MKVNMKRLIGIKLGLPTKYVTSYRMEGCVLTKSTYFIYNAVDWGGDAIAGAFPLSEFIGSSHKHKVTAFTGGLNKQKLSEHDTGKYIIRKELTWIGDNRKDATEMESCYNYDNNYIGDIKTARFICDKIGIAPEIIPNDNSNVCCIGYCKKENKWYGWSHRAIQRFGAGDRIFEERYGNDSTYFNKHGSKVIKTLEDAKQAAINFAKYIG